MSISWPLERRKDTITRNFLTKTEKYKLWYTEWGVLVLSSIIVALSASFVSVATTWLAMFRQGYCGSSWILTHYVCENQDWKSWPKPVGWLIYTLLSLAYAMLASSLVKFAPGSVMSGTAELKSYFQGFEIPQFLDWRTLAVKLFGIGFTSASGMWLGQEAPLAHVAAATTAIIASMLPISEARRRDLIQATTAAGISVAFSAPLGGVLFGLEMFMPSKKVMRKMFVCSMVASVILRMLVAPSSASGGIVVPETGLFHVSYDRMWHAVELIPFFIIGIIGGIYGAIVPKLARIPVNTYNKYPHISVAVIALTTALLSYVTVVSRIPSTELLAQLFAECREDDQKSLFCSNNTHIGGLIYTLALGSILAPLSFTLPVPSGILFPNILLGALFGRLVGLAMTSILKKLPGILSTSFCPDSSQHCITPGVYALVGAGAFLTGVTRLTVSSVVLMFEITGALSYIVPIMTGVIVAKWVSDTLSESSSIYDIWQSVYNIPIFPDSSTTAPDLYASEIMKPSESVVAIRQTSNSTGRTLPSSPYKSVPILGPENELLDFVIAKTGKSEPMVLLSPKASLHLVESSILQLGVRVVLLCSRGEFKGLITRSDVIRALKNSKSFVSATDISEFEIGSD